MRTTFGKTLVECARADDRIFLLTGDLGHGVVEPFRDEFPDRYVNVGVAEQNMVGVATGLALSGYIVFTYSISNFAVFRCLEQIRNDVCYHNVNVKIIAVGCGLGYGPQGMTHHGTEDIAVMRVLPNLTVVGPADPIETMLATRALVERSGPGYLRLGETNEPILYEEMPDFQIGRAITLRDGHDLTLIATGAILGNVLQAAEQLADLGIHTMVMSMHTLKPIDEEAILKAAKQTRAIITVEEHRMIGGLGSACLEILSKTGYYNTPLQIMALSDSFSKIVGRREHLRQVSGLSVDSIRTCAEQVYRSIDYSHH